MSPAKKPPSPGLSCTGLQGSQRKSKGGAVRRSRGGGRWRKDGKDLEQHSGHGEGQAEVEGSRCCPTRQK